MRLSHNTKTVADGHIFGSQNKILDNQGNINASSKEDLIRNMLEIATQMQNGNLVADEPVNSRLQAETAAENRAMVRDAYYSEGKEWAELGAAITFEVNNRIEREGLMRTILAPGDIQDGSIARVRVKQKNVTAIATRGLAQVYPQYVRETFITMDEFYVTAQPRIEERDLVTSSGDLLDDKYFEGLEAIMVQEDRVLVQMLREADGISNPLINFSGAFTPGIFAAVKHLIDGWGIPVGNAIIAMDLLTDISTGATFGTWFDPISQWEIIKTGRIGSILGVNLVTDGYRDPQLKVLNQGEFFVLGAPDYLGGYTERGPVQSRPVDEFDKFVPARGWSMFELISMVVANARAVARAQRI